MTEYYFRANKLEARRKIVPAITVKGKYATSGRRPNVSFVKSVMVRKKPATESEISAELKRTNPKWTDFVMLEIKQ